MLKNGTLVLNEANIKSISNEEKKEYGMKVNEVRTYFNNLYEEKNKLLEEELLNKKLESEKIDITLPSTRIRKGTKLSFQDFDLYLQNYKDKIITI